MSEVFGARYAGFYDALYADKDYDAECATLGRIFEKYGERPVRSVLDLGCGTGAHALRLAQRGIAVTAVDRSAEMLAIAQAKPGGERVAFHQGDIQKLDLGRRFDAALMMFAVLGYQHENREVLAALRCVRRHLHPGGLFVCDIWFGPTVLAEKPSARTKEIPTPGGRIVRHAAARLDVMKHLCSVHYRCTRYEKEREVESTEETHLMRYFFPREIELLFETADLSLVRLGAFPDFEQDLDANTWNAWAIARAR